MKKIISIIFLVLTATVFVSCDGQVITNPNIDYCVESDTDGVYICNKTSTSYFDTTIQLKLYYTEDDQYDVSTIFDTFMETLETYHQLFDKYNAYEGITNVYTINQNNTSETTISEELFLAIQFALENQNLVIDDETALFNIALNPVLNVWHNARESSACDSTYELGVLWCPVPYDEIDGLTFNTDPNDIVLDDENLTISFQKTDMGIDLGGYGKGYVSNIIAEYLNSLNITYLLNAGNSNIIANNANPIRDTGLYYIALIEPNVDFTVGNTYYQYIQLPEDYSVVTSGNYQRYFKEIDSEGNYSGDVYHHIIDPRTNYPGGDCMSVTVIYPDSALADIYSTAIYLLDLEEAVAYVNSVDDLEAVWYDYDGNILYSDGFLQYNYEILE